MYATQTIKKLQPSRFIAFMFVSMQIILALSIFIALESHLV